MPHERRFEDFVDHAMPWAITALKIVIPVAAFVWFFFLRGSCGD